MLFQLPVHNSLFNTGTLAPLELLTYYFGGFMLWSLWVFTVCRVPLSRAHRVLSSAYMVQATRV